MQQRRHAHLPGIGGGRLDPVMHRSMLRKPAIREHDLQRASYTQTADIDVPTGSSLHQMNAETDQRKTSRQGRSFEYLIEV